MGDFFGCWRPVRGDVAVESEWNRFCSYSQQSPALLLPSARDASQHTVLPLFGAASASTSNSGLLGSGSGSGAAADSSSTEGSRRSSLRKSEARDVLCYAGGPVWALDWCPAGTSTAAAGGAGGSSGGAPVEPASGAGRRVYLAVGCHPLQATHNLVGAAVRGPTCIQIWELTHPDQQQREQQQQQRPEGAPEEAQLAQQASWQLPRMALALAHDGGLAWHCQWCPDPALEDVPAAAPGSSGSMSDSSGSGTVLPRLGLLAAALGDGSMRVWAVPHPQAAGQQQAQAPPQQQAAAGPVPPLLLSVPPVAFVSSAHLGGSMPCLVDWLPAAPYDLLLVGCWDGSVALFKLAPGQHREQQQQGSGAQPSPAQEPPPPPLPPQQQQNGGPGSPGDGGGGSGGGGPSSGSSSSGGGMWGLELLAHFNADMLPLRTLRWVPPAACGTAADSLHRHLFLTGGHESSLRIWDIRDPFQPLYSHVLSSSSTILAADWTSRPFGIMVGMEDASLRGLVLNSDVIHRATVEEKKAMFSISWRGFSMGATWALAVQPTLQIVAYGGEDGEVGVFQAEYEGKAKRRMAHAAVAGLRLEGEALVVKTPQDMEGEQGLFNGRVIERTANLKGARLPDEAEAVHRVAWSRHAAGGAWLASAGAAGLVRCQWIQSK